AGAGCACLLTIFLMRWLQGPAGLLAPAGLAALACWCLFRRASFTRGEALLGGFLVLIVVAGHPALRTSLSLRLTETPLLERWNEHSRILALPISTPHFPVAFVIDRTASTDLPRVAPRPQESPVRPEAWWIQGISNLAYRLGRPLERAAVIGVGGGR